MTMMGHPKVKSPPSFARNAKERVGHPTQPRFFHIFALPDQIRRGRIEDNSSIIQTGILQKNQCTFSPFC